MLGGNLGLSEVIDRQKSGYYKNVAPGLVEAEKARLEKLRKLGIDTRLSEGKTSVLDGRLVAKDRPSGFLGGLASTGDFLTFGISDWDKKGNLFGGQHSGSGYGGLQEGTERDGGKIVLKEGFEYKDPLDPDSGTQKEGTREEEALKKEIAAETRKEELGIRGANRQLFNAQLAAIPDIMLRGGEGVAKIYSDQAANTLQWAANLPKYNLPAMNYTALRNYGLGG
tara:strand:+ start:912 stop:1586 length:675 start_codon:yes stop_codon:yes gene_type:complete